jgi:hypothetical protein
MVQQFKNPMTQQFQNPKTQQFQKPFHPGCDPARNPFNEARADLVIVILNNVGQMLILSCDGPSKYNRIHFVFPVFPVVVIVI